MQRIFTDIELANCVSQQWEVTKASHLRRIQAGTMRSLESLAILERLKTAATRLRILATGQGLFRKLWELLREEYAPVEQVPQDFAVAVAALRAATTEAGRHAAAIDVAHLALRWAQVNASEPTVVVEPEVSTALAAAAPKRQPMATEALRGADYAQVLAEFELVLQDPRLSRAERTKCRLHSQHLNAAAVRTLTRSVEQELARRPYEVVASVEVVTPEYDTTLPFLQD